MAACSSEPELLVSEKLIQMMTFIQMILGFLSLNCFSVAVFGLGTLIYDGLEFGAFLEITQDSPCHTPLRGINPVLHAIFVFLQMYFVFISARVSYFYFYQHLVMCGGVCV